MLVQTAEVAPVPAPADRRRRLGLVLWRSSVGNAVVSGIIETGRSRVTDQALGTEGAGAGFTLRTRPRTPHEVFVATG